MTIFVGKRPKTPPKPRSSAKARRSAARLAAVQVLYEIAQTGKSAAEALAEFIEFRIGHEVDGEKFVAADVLGHVLSKFRQPNFYEKDTTYGLINDFYEIPYQIIRISIQPSW